MRAFQPGMHQKGGKGWSFIFFLKKRGENFDDYQRYQLRIAD